MRVHCRVFAVAVFVLVSTAVPHSFAAIGIFNWYARSSQGATDIHYYLNLTGDTGYIEICPELSGLPQEPVRTISLSASDLTSGPHIVTWDGKDDSGKPASSGSYLARIYVHAAPVPSPSDPNDPLQMSANLKILKSNSRFYGVGVDTNPENNNQQDPSKSTYGLVYVANMLSNKIEVYYPDGVLKYIWPNNVASPWGLSVSEDGRVFTVSQAFWVLYNFTSDGSDVLGGNACSVTYGGGAAWGKSFEGTGRYQTLHNGKIREWILLSQPVPSPTNPDRFTNYDIAQVIETVISDPSECYQTAKDTSSGCLYLAQANSIEQPSLQRYLWNGAGYTRDTSWTPDAGTNVDGVSISQADSNLLLIGRELSTGPNLERWYIENPDPEISGPSMLDSYRPVSGMIHNTASDSRGNVVFDAGGRARGYYQTIIGMFIFPDNGSEDTRIAGPFTHEGSGQVFLKERIRELGEISDGIRVEIRGKIVSGCVDGAVYVQESDRASGVRVEPSEPISPSPGSIVDVSGVVDRTTGEIRLLNASIMTTGTDQAPKPLFMNTFDVKNDPSRQLDFIGINNMGLLVKTAGEVTSIDSTSGLFYIDDGRGLDNGFSRRGLAVRYDGLVPPLVGDWISVTGLSSCRPLTLAADTIINGIPVAAGTTVYEPVLLPRAQSDIMQMQR